jgi:serine/threonine protein kinase
LRQEAEQLLAAIANARSEQFLDADVFALGAQLIAANEPLAEKVSERIGPYRVLRELGRGGMGTVFLAEREEPRQRVAIKVIKRGMDTDEIITRFRRERQLLAALNHPNIARLLDGATTEDGLPYFVLEHVDGLPITEYCDEQKLDINRRLQLFQKICGAVSYIHRNLIVHRDIKPSNILVTEDGEPKLLDFGIAKLLASEDVGTTIVPTVAGVRLLTPDYASPEQINGDQITTASDIYSLGVVLYELLSGRRPFHLRNRPTREVLEIIARQDPPSPSTALVKVETNKQTTGQALSPDTVAQSRSEKIKGLRRRLSGDLDNITRKALRKEPERRYQTVEQLADDVKRHLGGLPVFARPDTWTYRGSKFIKRNFAAVTLSALLVVALAVGVAATVRQSIRANRQRLLAQQRAAETRRFANSLLNEFDEEIGNLASSYPTRIKLAQASSEYLDRIAQQTDDPAAMGELAEAHLRLSLVYGGVNDQKQAKRQWEMAVEIARGLVAARPQDLIAKKTLAKSLAIDEHAGSEALLWEALRLRQELVAAKPNDFQALQDLADSYMGLGIRLTDLQRRDEALINYQSSIETWQRMIQLLEKQELTVDQYDALYWGYLWMGLTQGNQFNDWKTSAITFRKAIGLGESAARKFPDHKRTQTNVHAAHSYLGRAFAKNGDYAAALQQYQVGLDSCRSAARKFNLFWQGTEVQYLLKIADTLLHLGKKDEALLKLREALAIRRETTQVDQANPRNKVTHGNVLREAGKILNAAGRPDEALALFHEVEQTWKQLLASDKDQVVLKIGLARVYLEIGDLYAACVSDGTEMKQPDRARLREASGWYQRATQMWEECGPQLILAEDIRDARLTTAKLAACIAKLGDSR